MTQKKDRYGRPKKKIRTVPARRRSVRQIKEEQMTEEERVREGQRLQTQLKRLDDAWLTHQKRERRSAVVFFTACSLVSFLAVALVFCAD